MKIEVRILDAPQRVNPSDRKSVSVEIQSRRNETYNILKSETMLVAPEPMIFDVPANGRLVFTAPDAAEDVVFDSGQMASIRPSAQRNSDVEADMAGRDPAPDRRLPDATKSQLTNQPGGRIQHSAQGAQGTSPPASRPGVQGAVAPDAAKKAEEQRAALAAAQKKLEDDKARDAASEKTKQAEEAKASQQSGASRPPGENPPLPGSPVGAPPAGNEGKSN